MDQSERKIGFSKRVVRQILSGCTSFQAKIYLAILSFIEASFFPIPPDLMLVPMVLANPKSAWRLAGLTTFFSVLGGIVGYWIGKLAFLTIGLQLIDGLHLSQGYQQVITWFETYGFTAVVLAGVTPIPYKAFTLGAGASQMAFFYFLVASLLGRAIRFYFVAGCVRYYGHMVILSYKKLAAVFLVVALTLLIGCAPPQQPAPIETRLFTPVKTGFHRVESDETLYSIAWRYDRDYLELAQLNDLSPPYRLQIGQHLRLGKFAKTHQNELVKKVRETPVSVVSSNHRVSQVKPTQHKWTWPVAGNILSSFSLNGSQIQKGIDISVTPGTYVRAAAAGKVVYAGNGLRSYGNLIIIKHDEAYLSAYAYNDALLVKEGEQVQVGGVIAKVGGLDSKHPKLHFEIRYHGQPQDPLNYLPSPS